MGSIVGLFLTHAFVLIEQQSQRVLGWYVEFLYSIDSLIGFILIMTTSIGILIAVAFLNAFIEWFQIQK